MVLCDISRVGDYKVIWGSRTTKDTWFPVQEEPINKFVCAEIMRARARQNRSRILLPRGVETMDVLELDLPEDVEYDYDTLERMQVLLLTTQHIFSKIFLAAQKYFCRLTRTVSSRVCWATRWVPCPRSGRGWGERRGMEEIINGIKRTRTRTRRTSSSPTSTVSASRHSAPCRCTT